MCIALNQEVIHGWAQSIISTVQVAHTKLIKFENMNSHIYNSLKSLPAAPKAKLLHLLGRNHYVCDNVITCVLYEQYHNLMDTGPSNTKNYP